MHFLGEGLDTSISVFLRLRQRPTSRPWLVRYRKPTMKMASRSWARVSSLVRGSCSRWKSMIGMDEKDMMSGGWKSLEAAWDLLYFHCSDRGRGRSYSPPQRGPSGSFLTPSLRPNLDKTLALSLPFTHILRRIHLQFLVAPMANGTESEPIK